MADAFRLKDIIFPVVIREVQASLFTGILFVSHDDIRKGVIFNQGQLCAIQSNRPEELLGYILTDLGLISEDENHLALEKATIERRKVGTILLEKGLIKPEDLQAALKRQVEIRLLDIFSWEDGEVRRITKESLDSKPVLGNSEFQQLIRRAIMEQTSFSAVINALSPYAEAKPKPLLETLPTDAGVDLCGIHAATVAEILLQGQQRSRALLGLWCTGFISFAESPHKALIDKLTVQLKEISNKDPFDVLGVDKDISDGGLKRAYIRIVKEHHPDTYSYADDPEVRELANEIFTEIQKAHTAVNRIRAGQSPDEQAIDESLRAELLYTQATEALRSKNYATAIDLLRLCTRMRPDERLFAETYAKTLFLRWQRSPHANSMEVKSAVHEGLHRFPQSDTLYVILGWVFKQEGEPRKGIEAFRQALKNNPKCVDAERELRLYEMRQKR